MDIDKDLYWDRRFETGETNAYGSVVDSDEQHWSHGYTLYVSYNITHANIDTGEIIHEPSFAITLKAQTLPELHSALEALNALHNLEDPEQ